MALMTGVTWIGESAGRPVLFEPVFAEGSGQAQSR